MTREFKVNFFLFWKQYKPSSSNVTKFIFLPFLVILKNKEYTWLSPTLLPHTIFMDFKIFQGFAFPSKHEARLFTLEEPQRGQNKQTTIVCLKEFSLHSKRRILHWGGNVYKTSEIQKRELSERERVIRDGVSVCCLPSLHCLSWIFLKTLDLGWWINVREDNTQTTKLLTSLVQKSL